MMTFTNHGVIAAKLFNHISILTKLVRIEYNEDIAAHTVCYELSRLCLVSFHISIIFDTSLVSLEILYALND